MDDFNSETDSDYTSYWRDWRRSGTTSEGPEDECDPTQEHSKVVTRYIDLADLAARRHDHPHLIAPLEVEVEVERRPNPSPIGGVVMLAGRYKKRRVVPQRHQTRIHPLRQSLHRSLTSSKDAQPQGQASVPSKTPHPVGSSPHGGATTAFESSDDFEPRASHLSKYEFQYHWRKLIDFPYLQPVDSSIPTFGSLVLEPITVSNKIMPIGFSWASDFGGRFISSRGNEYFCEIDEDYLTDRFNLTGLNTEVQYYQYALDLVTDVFDLDCDDDMRETIEKSARHLYGLVHARYIVTTRGLAKMLEKYKKADFGKCPRVMCKSHPLLPMGQSDNPNVKAVKLYCARCEDIYNPKSSRHSAIDGAYFGTSFHNIIFQVYPALIPSKSYERYSPRIYGFKVHAPATLIRWQHAERDEMRKRLRKLEIESGFKDDEEDVADDSEEDEEENDMVLENGQVVEAGMVANQV